ncbi:hypothetical protein ncot_15555 [Nocardioides sp. JQ2195]|uniref:hypothetical protein n=1 Tax=Nocardioides sp. JQ2195 TaxID=2592334 RepID=UPI00143EC21E|nr:hypothetical protein [Nocardioides sp. JQ2195]QIX27846.1 hypothetical protein ncot_15555 [Nocardioides sp. JQ2195]
MNRNVTVFLAVAALTVGGSTAYASTAFHRYWDRYDDPPTVALADNAGTLPHGDRIVFRHTGIDDHYGLVAMVPLDDPDGPRSFTDVACDRVDASTTEATCLVTERGVVTTFEALELDADWDVRETHGLPGIPSRTRLSPDGTLVATTSFVTGHTYMTTGFSTATEIREVGGQSLGNLERFELRINDKAVHPVDRNVWGVTFVDDRTFYATVATGGRTYLTQGDLTERTLTAISTNAECPSVSPDATKVAFKVLDDKEWEVAVLDLATGERTVLPHTRGLDDQVEWLDEDTLLYGLPRSDEPGVTDIWSIDTRPEAEPTRLIEQAWSPSVIRTGDQ